MNKNDRRQEAPANPQDAPQKPAQDLEALVKSQLAPVGEFRDRAESWMKEITAQVARLAGRSEEEDRRKQAIDKRLADFEERMQSLLTLTELVSIDKNPFAGKPPSASAAPAPAAPPAAVAAPAAQPAPAPAASVVQPAEDEDPSEGLVPAVAAPTAPTPTSRAGPASSNAGRLPRRAHNHPNDAAAERISLSDEDDFAPPPAAPAQPVFSAEPHRVPAVPGFEARRRLTILEWSKLLAPHLARFDLGAFLGFYVESGWIDRDTAACVRNLAQQLRAADGDAEDDSKLTLDELHARSILVLSHLGAEPVATETASAILRDARSATQGGWLTPTA